MSRPTTSSEHKSHRAISVRLDTDLENNVEQWLAKNPGIHLSRLINLAIRRFISEPQTLQPVSLAPAKDTVVKRSMKKMMRQHQDMLDKLK
jgi:antitoxin component of RelBE/YafQ-DinJ toxin-antitoxin module